MAGSPSGTDLAVIQDLAEVLDDGDNLRVLPMVGKGPEQNIKDVMFLRGVDMGITQANLLKHFDRTGDLGPNLRGRITYIAKLFNEEMHVLVRSEVNDIKELNGKPVNFGARGSGTEITGRLIFAALGLLAGAGGFWLLWQSPGPRPGPHRVTVTEGSALAVGGATESRVASSSSG